MDGSNVGYDQNVYTTDNWADMEASGCVFLPAAGHRGPIGYLNTNGNDGMYWTSSLVQIFDGASAGALKFTEDGVYSQNEGMVVYNGLAVRLVRDEK